jgi:hypothetical protein
MNLSSGMAYAAIVGVASLEVPSLDRVAPGDPANSYLVRKINGGPSILGARMPLGGPFLTSAEDCPDHELGAARGAEQLSRRHPPRRFPPTQLPDASDV